MASFCKRKIYTNRNNALSNKTNATALTSYSPLWKMQFHKRDPNYLIKAVT
jgi:hypothetical protein